MSYSYTESSTFTIPHARHMAAKIATDLKRAIVHARSLGLRPAGVIPVDKGLIQKVEVVAAPVDPSSSARSGCPSGWIPRRDAPLRLHPGRS